MVPDRRPLERTNGTGVYQLSLVEGRRHCYTAIRTGNTSLRSILYAMIIAAHGDRCVAVYNIRTMGL
jgi:hypothetical protein